MSTATRIPNPRLREDLEAWALSSAEHAMASEDAETLDQVPRYSDTLDDICDMLDSTIEPCDLLVERELMKEEID